MRPPRTARNALRRAWRLLRPHSRRAASDLLVAATRKCATAYRHMRTIAGAAALRRVLYSAATVAFDCPRGWLPTEGTARMGADRVCARLTILAPPVRPKSQGAGPPEPPIRRLV